ncbi:purine-binding chemotaxis protein CheW [Keratinibaculum paraultunense]|uniref:Chemotaxis protein CheW n=1 Tax=Keratinibaculum paraultunense TaxID=1278232 RepID=A0A4R3KRY0_9FIRM|nr:chemotaxis protein CheW [Keratinibaculum paraultunense]QQY78783.1 purine-binding chemotaxis protein CheW [Keratinibaculum paraultunense]TCS87511.1 purine-binding chemotaxis protein CheW [Keratinibaculum paraultunense]
MSENQYVVFKLDENEFGIDIMNVKEIIPYQEPVHVPNTPDFVEGIINYRGNVIPVINLRERFDMDVKQITKDTRIIVITLKEKEVGFIVDEASQTIRLNEEQIDPAPGIIAGIEKRYITGIGKVDENRLIILLDLKEILTDEEKNEIENMEL